MSQPRFINTELETPGADPQPTRVRNRNGFAEEQTDTAPAPENSASEEALFHPKGTICCRGKHVTGQELTRIAGRVYNRRDDPDKIDNSGNPVNDPEPYPGDNKVVFGKITAAGGNTYEFCFELNCNNEIAGARARPAPRRYNEQQLFLWAEYEGSKTFCEIARVKINGESSNTTECDQ